MNDALFRFGLHASRHEREVYVRIYRMGVSGLPGEIQFALSREISSCVRSETIL